jgi:hypothetical protein
MTDSVILLKVKKLLALAESGNEYESKLAAEKANAILVKHNLTMQQAQQSSADYENFEFDLGSKRTPVTLKFVAAIVKAHFFVEVVTSRKICTKSLRFLGKKDNVEVAVYVYGFLSNKFQELWLEYKKTSGAPASHKQSYWLGLYQGLNSQLLSQRKKVEQEEGLVLVKDKGLDLFRDQQYPNLKKGSNSSFNAYGDSISAGKQDGVNIRISKAMHSNGTATNLKLGS